MSVPTMIRLGYKLSYSARLSRKNSGLNNNIVARHIFPLQICWYIPPEPWI